MARVGNDSLDPAHGRPGGERAAAYSPAAKAVQEECRSWDVNEVVFSPALWGSYQPLMRADFTLFDSYCFQHQGVPCIALRQHVAMQCSALW